MYNVLGMPVYWLKTALAKRRYQVNWRVTKVAYGPTRKQYYLVVEHKNMPLSTPTPWAIYLHGGAWTFGSPEQFLPAAHPFIAAGYRVVLPSYRRLTQQNFDGIWEDLTACLSNYQQTYAGAGPTVLAGMSGGGHLAASLASHPRVWKQLGWATPTAAILCGAVLDLETMPDSFGMRKLAGPRGSAQFNRANPAWWVQQNEQLPGRYLLVHGDADKMVALQQSIGYFEVLTQKKINAELYVIQGGTHLDACRWMYRNDEVSLKIKQLLAQI